MLLNVREYHRPGETAPGGAPVGRQPERLDEVIGLLARPGVRTAALAGGHTLAGCNDRTLDAVVDLQGLGLDRIEVEEGRLRIGAMATRAALAGIDPESLPDFGSVLEIVIEGAHHWGGSVQRNRATVGGAAAVAANDDPLLAALLAADADVALWGRDGARELPLIEFLAERAEILSGPAVITDVVITARGMGELKEVGARTGAGMAMVGRTPADAPIVAAAAVLTLNEGPNGAVCRAARLALAGIGGLFDRLTGPRRLTEAEAMLLGQVINDALITAVAKHVAHGSGPALGQPAGDYRGSAEYRKAVAGTLSARALQEAWDRAK